MEDGLIVAEGPHLLQEALRSSWSVAKILTTPIGTQRYQELLRASRAEVVQVSSRAFASAASTETTQEIIALLRPRAWRFRDLLQNPALLVGLDAVQDPGNAGTAVRSAEAFGATGIVLLQGCVRPANGKFLRAAAGSLFRVPFLEGISAAEFIQQAAENRINIYALSATAEVRITEADFKGPCCLVTGNEGSGVSEGVLAQAQPLCIPTMEVESLNAAVACSLALFEAYRQRFL